jgi:hypothetical protein
LLQVAELVVEVRTKDQLMTVLPVAAMYRELVQMVPAWMVRLDLDMVAVTAGGMALAAADGLVELGKTVVTHQAVAVMLLLVQL